jgi:tRNA (guanine37-N1)-methyltransferase
VTALDAGGRDGDGPPGIDPLLRVDVVTIFPAYLAPLDMSLLGKARGRGLVDVRIHDLRSWTSDIHRTVDDEPYGGGPGMVMRPEPWWAALTEITGRHPDAGAALDAPHEPVSAMCGPAVAGSVGPGAGRSRPRGRVIVPTPSGRPFTQELAAELAAEPWLVFCCGRYEGIDGRVVDAWADDEVSIGDYVLSGGEVATLVMVEAITRLLPGVVGNAESIADDSFAHGLLEGPVFTRPVVWQGREVPAVLRSGDHGAIARWRRDEALRRTARRRPDLLGALDLSEPERGIVAAAIESEESSAASGADRPEQPAEQVGEPAARPG